MNAAINIRPGRPGSARVQFFACREEVEALLAKGYSVRMVYEQMQEQGRITCSYSAFCDYVRGEGKRQHSRKNGKLKASQTPLPTQQKNTGPKIVTQRPNGFPDPRAMSLEDAF